MGIRTLPARARLRPISSALRAHPCKASGNPNTQLYSPMLQRNVALSQCISGIPGVHDGEARAGLTARLAFA